jgi:hypothetical protein
MVQSSDDQFMVVCDHILQTYTDVREKLLSVVKACGFASSRKEYKNLFSKG